MSLPIVVKTINLKAPINSPEFTGEPKAPTPATGDSSTKLATTEFLTNTETLTKYVKKSGDTMTGALNFANATWNLVGDDAFIGDDNIAGHFCIKGNNGTTGLQFNSYTSSNCARLTFNDTYLSCNYPISMSPVLCSTWIKMSHEAPFKITTPCTSSEGSTGLSMKTISGAWGIGVYEENLRFIYGTDTDYNAGTNTVGNSTYIDSSGRLWGAVWNDYAEFRSSKSSIEPGRCVIEQGDDTLALASERMQPGANIVSDTFGFSIGHNDELAEDTQLPIAVSGRVLAYGYESLDEFRANIGRPVCSGPNGTVSIMTDEEYRDRGYCAIGTISAVPEYEVWGNRRSES